jgi:F420-dependent oxidoreductase-like protein
VQVGVIVPQGWTGDYNGWEPRKAWERSVAVARQADALGFESIWLFDHFHTEPDPTDELTFESFTSLSALAALTHRIRLGHIVACAAYRNAALTAKMISTMDVISGGRMELGIGAGWKEDEWRAYGYGFPETPVRLAILRDQLEVITRMLAPGRTAHATYEGRHAGVFDAINLPKPLQQPRVPIMVGGNGQNVTWRIAARFADELNVDGLRASEVKAALPIIRSRCEEIGRDPASLRVSVHVWWSASRHEGSRRVDMLAGYREAGVQRVMTLIRRSTDTDEALASFAADCRTAGVELAPQR